MWCQTKRAVADGEKTISAAEKSAQAALDSCAAMIEANGINREAMIADQRPWVSVTVTQVAPITWDSNGANFTFDFILENTGKTPAVNARIDMKVFGDRGVNDIERQRTLSLQAEKSQAFMGVTLFPGKTATMRISTIIGQAELDDRKRGWLESYKKECDWIMPVLIGCVTYDNVFNDVRRQTGFIREILCAIPKDNSVAIGPSVGNIPLERLVLMTPLRDGITS